MKRFALAMIVVLCAALFGPVCAAQATDGKARVSFTVTCNPAELSQEGEASLLFTIELLNGDSGTIELIDAQSEILDGKTITFSEPVFSKQRRTGTYKQEIYVSDEMFGREYEITLRYRDFDSQMGVVTAKVQIKRGEPNLLFSRSVSSTSARSGGTITITYELENLSNTPITNIDIYDDAVLKQPYHLDVLLPGATHREVRQFSLSSDTVTEPRVHFTYELAGEVVERTVIREAVTLYRQVSQMDVKLSAQSKELALGESTTIWVTVRNEGTVPYYSVTLEGEFLSDSIAMGTLEPGDTNTVACVVQPLASHAYTFTARGLLSDGNASVKTSEELSIQVMDAPEVDEAVFATTQDAAKISIAVETSVNDDSIACEVVVRSPDSVLSNVRLRETTSGTLVGTAETLSADKRFPVVLSADDVGEVLQFTLEAVDQNGVAVVRQEIAKVNVDTATLAAGGSVDKASTSMAVLSTANFVNGAAETQQSQTLPSWLTALVTVFVVLLCLCLFALACLHARELWRKAARTGAG